MQTHLTTVQELISRAQVRLDQGHDERETLIDLARELDISFRSMVDCLDGNPYFVDFEKSLELALEQ